jgi:hypothetical protein
VGDRGKKGKSIQGRSALPLYCLLSSTRVESGPFGHFDDEWMVLVVDGYMTGGIILKGVPFSDWGGCVMAGIRAI